MKNDGVPVTPLAMPLAKSSFTRAMKLCAVQACCSSRPDQTQPLGHVQHPRVGQVLLRVVERLVHRPERALRRRPFGLLGGVLRVRMAARQREMPEHEPQPVAERVDDARDDRARRGALGALEVAVLDQRHRRRTPHPARGRVAQPEASARRASG